MLNELFEAIQGWIILLGICGLFIFLSEIFNAEK